MSWPISGSSSSRELVYPLMCGCTYVYERSCAYSLDSSPLAHLWTTLQTNACAAAKQECGLQVFVDLHRGSTREKPHPPKDQKGDSSDPSGEAADCSSARYQGPVRLVQQGSMHPSKRLPPCLAVGTAPTHAAVLMLPCHSCCMCEPAGAHDTGLL